MYFKEAAFNNMSLLLGANVIPGATKLKTG
jgi:hypothetical protein